MNRRLFLKLLGCLGIAPVVPAVASVTKTSSVAMPRTVQDFIISHNFGAPIPLSDFNREHYAQILLQMYDKNLISNHTLLKEIGIDPKEEMRKIAEEHENIKNWTK
jgi:hypothetical protein